MVLMSHIGKSCVRATVPAPENKLDVFDTGEPQMERDKIMTALNIDARRFGRRSRSGTTVGSTATAVVGAVAALVLTAGAANASTTVTLPTVPVVSALAGQQTTAPFVDISAFGQQVPFDYGPVCDDCKATVGLPFTFRMFGVTTDQVTVSSNGLAALAGPGTTRYWNRPLPDSDPRLRDTLMPFFADLETSVKTATVGSTGHRQFVVQWDGGFCCGRPWASPTISFQLVLNEGSNTAEFRYQNVSTAYRPITIGAVGGTPGDAFQVLYGDPAALSGKSLRIGGTADLAPAPPAPPAWTPGQNPGYRGFTPYHGYNPGFAPYGGGPVAPPSAPVNPIPNTAGQLGMDL